jgi:hypothetical protein
MGRMSTITASYPVPYYSQFASPDRIAEFLEENQPIASDPRWAEYGASSPEEYAHWSIRACGVVCVKMAVEALSSKPDGSIMEWVRRGLALDGFLIQQTEEGPKEIGWKHTALAALAEQNGLMGTLVSELTLPVIADHIAADRMVIASVTPEIGWQAPITRRSGHLVVIYGVELSDTGQIEALILHNPSGHTEALRAGAILSASRFEQAFSGRGIVIGGPG